MLSVVWQFVWMYGPLLLLLICKITWKKDTQLSLSPRVEYIFKFELIDWQIYCCLSYSSLFNSCFLPPPSSSFLVFSLFSHCIWIRQAGGSWSDEPKMPCQSEIGTTAVCVFFCSVCIMATAGPDSFFSLYFLFWFSWLPIVQSHWWSVRRTFSTASWLPFFGYFFAPYVYKKMVQIGDINNIIVSTQ